MVRWPAVGITRQPVFATYLAVRDVDHLSHKSDAGDWARHVRRKVLLPDMSMQDYSGDLNTS
jgi:hypothetical protein